MQILLDGTRATYGQFLRVGLPLEIENWADYSKHLKGANSE